MRAATCRKTWVSDTGNPHLFQTARWLLYDPSYNWHRSAPFQREGRANE
jgi:hypothetical protein